MLLSFARALGASLVVLLVVAWVMDGASSFKHCIQEKQQQAASDYPKDNFGALGLEVHIRRDCFVSFVKEHKDEVLAAFTILLTFATIFLWFATGDLVRGAERTAKKQLRAYISVANGDIGLVNGEGGMIAARAQITIKNFGQTPAYGSAAWAVVRVLDAETTDFSMEKGDRPPSRAIMGPGAETIIARLVVVSQDDLAAIHAGEKRIFVWGRVEYRDTFNRRRRLLFHHSNSRVQEFPGRWGIEPYGDGEQGN